MTTPDLPDWLTKVSLQSDLVLYTGTLSAVGGQSPLLDVSAYNSVLIIWSDPTFTVNSVKSLQMSWATPTPVGLLADYFNAPATASLISGSIALPVRGQDFLMFNFGPLDLAVTIIGSQRIVPTMTTNGYIDTSYWVATMTPWVIGARQPLAGPVDGYMSQGLHQIAFRTSNAAVTGLFLLNAYDSAVGPFDMVLADTSEMHVMGPSSWVYKQVILPAGGYTPYFHPYAGGNATVDMRVTALGH